MEQSPFNLSAEDFLKSKLEYHKEQMKFHAKMVNETSEDLKKLQGKSKVTAPAEVAQTASKAVEGFSVTDWKPRVLQVLKASKNPMKTAEILAALEPDYLKPENKGLKDRATQVISSSLTALVLNNVVLKHETDGRGFAYTINPV